MEKFIPEVKHVPVDFDPFAGAPLTRTAPTTEAQKEIWTATQMGDDASCAYNEAVSLRLEGTLDRPAIEKATQQLVVRHESLRAIFNSTGSRIIIHEPQPIEVEHFDLSGMGSEEQKEEQQAILHELMSKPMDLLAGPLFRVQLIKFGNELHQLRLAGHHIVCDGWSLGIMMGDVSQLYSAFKKSEEPQLADAVPFSTYSTELIKIGKTEEHEKTKQYWLDLYKGSVPRMDLPTDKPRPTQKSYNGERVDLELSGEKVKRLKAVSTRSGSSLVTTLLTAFEVMLSEITGDNDIVVGLPAAGQSDLDMHALVGHCVNLLPLRSSIDRNRPFIEHLKARRTAVLDAYDNQRFTFGSLLQSLNIPREAGRIPLVPVVFNIDMNMDDGVAFSGLKHTFISDPREYENFELFLNATGSEEKLILEWAYNSDLFDRATVEGWMDKLIVLIDNIAADPTQTIGELSSGTYSSESSIMPPASWAGTAPDIPRDKSIGQLFEEVAKANADAPALVMENKNLSYRELRDRTDAIAMELIKQGVKPGDPIGLCVERSFDMIVSMLAILRAGGCFVPFDPSYPAERLQFMFKDTGVQLLITEKHLQSVLPKHEAKVLLLRDIKADKPDVRPPHNAKFSDPAYIMYTSGSSGTPKGVVVPHRAVIRLVREQNFLPFGNDLVFLQLSNISFDASTLEIWGALLNGAKLVLQPQIKPTLEEITSTIRKHRVTTVWFTVGLFNLLVDERLNELTGLKHILTGGDVLSVPHVKKALKELGSGVLINGYGPTENTTFTCCFPINSEQDIKGSVPIGKPIHNTSIQVLNDQLQPVPVGSEGELYAGGDGVAIGYWKRADLTEEHFVADPQSKGTLMYRTGDLVRWNNDGNIEFIGRADGQVKVRGFRIELGEIEAAMDGIPGLKDRVVVCRTDRPGEKQLVAYVVANNAPLNEEVRDTMLTTVREHLKNDLPVHMLPTVYVVLEELPLTANGKVDKRALPAPDPRSAAMRTQFVAPRTDLEKALSSIWSNVLEVEQLGIHDNFFEIGGHSLLGIQMFAKVKQLLGKELPFKTLFQAPTVSKLAKMLEQDGWRMPLKNLSAIQPEGSKIPFFCVHGDEANYFLPKYLGNDQPFYAFFHQGEDGTAIEHQTVEAIAGHFIKELMMVRSSGPYMLGGYSFGGIVAYEMAQQLTTAGHEVSLLAMFDTFDKEEYQKAMQEEENFYDPIKRRVMRRIAGRYLKRKEPLPAKLRHFYIIDTYDQAIRAYDIKPYKGKVTVMKAEKVIGPDHLGWAAHAAQVETYSVAGDHYSVVKEPDVIELAQAVQRSIELLESTASVEAV